MPKGVLFFVFFVCFGSVFGLVLERIRKRQTLGVDHRHVIDVACKCASDREGCDMYHHPCPSSQLSLRKTRHFPVQFCLNSVGHSGLEFSELFTKRLVVFFQLTVFHLQSRDSLRVVFYVPDTSLPCFLGIDARKFLPPKGGDCLLVGG